METPSYLSRNQAPRHSQGLTVRSDHGWCGVDSSVISGSMSCRRLMKGPTHILRMPSLRWSKLPLVVCRMVDRVRISDRDDAGLVSSVPIPRHDPRHDPPAAVGLAGHQGGAARKSAQLPIRKPCTEYGYWSSLIYGVCVRYVLRAPYKLQSNAAGKRALSVLSGP